MHRANGGDAYQVEKTVPMPCAVQKIVCMCADTVKYFGPTQNDLVPG